MFSFAGDSAGGNLAAAVVLRLKAMKHIPKPKLQVLIYPALQAFDLTLPAYVDNSGLTIGNKEILAYVLLQYLGGHAESYVPMLLNNEHLTGDVRQQYQSFVNVTELPERYIPVNASSSDSNVSRSLDYEHDDIVEKLESKVIDPYCMPLMATDLSNVPDTYIMTAEYDMLRDDGILYAQRLKKAGGNVTHVNYLDGFHGIMAFFDGFMKIDVGVKSMNHMIAYLQSNLFGTTNASPNW